MSRSKLSINWNHIARIGIRTGVGAMCAGSLAAIIYSEHQYDKQEEEINNISTTQAGNIEYSIANEDIFVARDTNPETNGQTHIFNFGYGHVFVDGGIKAGEDRINTEGNFTFAQFGAGNTLIDDTKAIACRLGKSLSDTPVTNDTDERLQSKQQAGAAFHKKHCLK